MGGQGMLVLVLLMEEELPVFLQTAVHVKAKAPQFSAGSPGVAGQSGPEGLEASLPNDHRHHQGYDLADCRIGCPVGAHAFGDSRTLGVWRRAMS